MLGIRSLLLVWCSLFWLTPLWAQTTEARSDSVLAALEQLETLEAIVSLHWSKDGSHLTAFHEGGALFTRRSVGGPPVTVQNLLGANRSFGVSYAVAATPWVGGRWLGFIVDSEIVVWDLITASEQSRLSMAPSQPVAVALDMKGDTAAFALDDGQVCAWELSEEFQVCRALEESGAIETLAIDAKGEVVAVGSWNHVAIWNLESDNRSHLRRDLGLQRMTFSPEGDLLALGSSDGSVHVWNLKASEPLETLGKHPRLVTELAFDATGRFLATGSDDRSVHLWGVNSRALLGTFEGSQSAITSLSFDPLSRSLAAGYADGSLRTWSASTGAPIRVVEPHRWPVTGLTWSQGSMLWALVPDRGALHGWDLPVLEERHRVAFALPDSEDGPDSLTAVAASPDGEYLVMGSRQGRLLIWTREGLVSGAGPYHDRKAHRGPVSALSFDPASRHFASGGWDRRIRLWRFDGSSPPLQLEAVDEPNPVAGRHHGGNLTALAFLEGSRLVSGARDNKVKIWDIESGQMASELDLGATPLALGSDPQGVLAVLKTEVVRWNSETEQIEQVDTLPSRPRLAEFSRDGSRLAWTTDQDGFLEVAELATDGALSAQAKLLSGSQGTWAGCSVEGTCRLRDDGSLLITLDADGTVTPLELQVPMAEAVEIVAMDERLEVRDGATVPLSLRVRNPTDIPVLGLRLEQLPLAGPLMIHPATRTVDLQPGEEWSLDASVSWASEYRDPVSGSSSLELQLVGRNLSPGPLPVISVERVGPELRLEDFEARPNQRDAKVRVVNGGALDLEALEARLELTGEGFSWSSEREPFELAAGQSQRLEFELPEGLAGPGLRAEVRVRSLSLPPHEWSVSRTLGPTQSPWLIAGGLFFVFSLVMLGFVHYTNKNRRFQNDPLVQRIEATPTVLRTLDMPLLPRVRSVLVQRKQLESVVGLAGTQVGWLDMAVAFATAKIARQRYEILADRLRLEPEGSDEKAGTDLWPLKLSSAFALNLDSCLLYFPSAEVVPSDVIKYLEHQSREDVVVVVSPKPEHQVELERLTSTDNHWVAPSMGQLTEIFLASNPLDKLAHVISDHVPLARIAPYQLRGGVDKPSLFFGREQLLVNIVDQVSNYLLVGGRQVGKSSLLKAVHRRFKGDDRIDCHYIVLSNHELLRRLARAIGIKKKPPDIVDVSRVLRGKKNGRYLILVDEADLFIKHDREQGFPMLQRLRSWSEEGFVRFVLTGFWQLFDASVLDYHSPIKNFGGTLTIGALERGACRRLATEPMALLKVRYESEDLVDRLIEETGQRANLVSIVCSGLIEGLSLENRVISSKDLDRALEHPRVTDALAGWGGLSGPDDETSNRIDRIVVYSTLERGEFTLGEVFAFFDQTGRPIQPEILERSLRRLELAFVLKRDGDQLGYQVPLFRRWILRQNPELLLEQELVWWRRESAADSES